MVEWFYLSLLNKICAPDICLTEPCATRSLMTLLFYLGQAIQTVALNSDGFLLNRDHAPVAKSLKNSSSSLSVLWHSLHYFI